MTEKKEWHRDKQKKRDRQTDLDSNTKIHRQEKIKIDRDKTEKMVICAII